VAYCTQDDLIEQITEEELIELTDDAGSGDADADAVARAIADADAEIDSYCGARYAVPFSTVPAIVRKVSVDIAVYNLLTRRAHLRGAVPEERQKRYENAVRLLREIAKGIVTLGASAPAPTTTSDAADIDGPPRRFTRARLRGF